MSDTPVPIDSSSGLVHRCRYCAEEVPAASVSRCASCGSWLTWRAHLLYPETLWVLTGVIVAVVAAAIAWSQAADARADRIATETLRRDISAVAENVTKMAFVRSGGRLGTMGWRSRRSPEAPRRVP